MTLAHQPSSISVVASTLPLERLEANISFRLIQRMAPVSSKPFSILVYFCLICSGSRSGVPAPGVQQWESPDFFRS